MVLVQKMEVAFEEGIEGAAELLLGLGGAFSKWVCRVHDLCHLCVSLRQKMSSIYNECILTSSNGDGALTGLADASIS